MKLAYITAYTPFGRGETFVLEEIDAMRGLGAELVIVPRNPPKEVFHEHAKQFIDNAIWLPLVNIQIFLGFMKCMAFEPRVWSLLGKTFHHSRTLKILSKNLAVFPKAVYIANLLHQSEIEHIHVHWGSTTSTMAWIASELINIPWSITLHRWDISENNLLKLKVDRAAFVRCISESGQSDLMQIVGKKLQEKIHVLHMGVRLPEQQSAFHISKGNDFVIACPANFVPVKGHRFLIDACRLLVTRGYGNIQCLIIGDGFVDREIQQQIELLGLENVVHLLGRMQHEKLLSMYAEKKVDAVVLPSIITDDGEREGIPVALMEAMAYGIPVISTETGGIPELLKGGAGLLVVPGSSEDLADAISKIIEDEVLRSRLAQKGRERVKDEFDLITNATILFKMMEKYRCERRHWKA